MLHVLDVDFPDKALEVILDYFMDMGIREEFYSFFNQLSDIYEIISPDDFFRPYIINFITLTRIRKCILLLFI